MSSKVVCIREALYSAISSVCSVSWLFAHAPGHDFTRNGKLPLEKLITLILSFKGGPLSSELMDHFGCSVDMASVPAFVKRRGRLLPKRLSDECRALCNMVDRTKLSHPDIILADR